MQTQVPKNSDAALVKKPVQDSNSNSVQKKEEVSSESNGFRAALQKAGIISSKPSEENNSSTSSPPEKDSPSDSSLQLSCAHSSIATHFIQRFTNSPSHTNTIQAKCSSCQNAKPSPIHLIQAKNEANPPDSPSPEPSPQACQAPPQLQEERLFKASLSNSTSFVQRKCLPYTAPQGIQAQVIQKKDGLPEPMKSNMEAMGGLSLDDVTVHSNSSKPAQVQAEAYAQGSDIYLAPGKEQHLGHEAWHTVQQKQGRVQPTIQTKNGLGINDDPALEQEADRMGNLSIQTNTMFQEPADSPAMPIRSTRQVQLKRNNSNIKVIQRVKKMPTEAELDAINIDTSDLDAEYNAVREGLKPHFDKIKGINNDKLKETKALFDTSFDEWDETKVAKFNTLFHKAWPRQDELISTATTLKIALKFLRDARKEAAKKYIEISHYLRMPTAFVGHNVTDEAGNQSTGQHSTSPKTLPHGVSSGQGHGHFDKERASRVFAAREDGSPPTVGDGVSRAVGYTLGSFAQAPFAKNGAFGQDSSVPQSLAELGTEAHNRREVLKAFRTGRHAGDGGPSQARDDPWFPDGGDDEASASDPRSPVPQEGSYNPDAAVADAAAASASAGGGGAAKRLAPGTDTNNKRRRGQ